MKNARLDNREFTSSATAPGGRRDWTPTRPVRYISSRAARRLPIVVRAVKGDKRKLLMEVTKIEPQSLPEDMFVVPSDFQEMKMPGM